jgi:hypothetical protein
LRPCCSNGLTSWALDQLEAGRTCRKLFAKISQALLRTQSPT